MLADLEARNLNIQLEGRALSSTEKLEFAYVLRDVILDNLLELEKMRKRQERVHADDFETLRFMIQEGYFTGRSKDDVNIFLRMSDELRDEALSQIAFLRQTDMDISSFECDAGFDEQEIDARSKVRVQHLATYAAEWGVS